MIYVKDFTGKMSAANTKAFKKEFRSLVVQDLTLVNTNAQTLVTPEIAADMLPIDELDTAEAFVADLPMFNVGSTKDGATAIVTFNTVHQNARKMLNRLFELQGGVVTWEQLGKFRFNVGIPADEVNGPKYPFMVAGNTATTVIMEYTPTYYYHKDNQELVSGKEAREMDADEIEEIPGIPTFSVKRGASVIGDKPKSLKRTKRTLKPKKDAELDNAA